MTPFVECKATTGALSSFQSEADILDYLFNTHTTYFGKSLLIRSQNDLLIATNKHNASFLTSKELFTTFIPLII